MTAKLPKATKLPRFKSYQEEADFYASHDLSELPGKEVKFKAAGPIRNVIQLEIDRDLFSALVAHAQAQGAPFSELVRRWIAEGLEREGGASTSANQR